VFVDLSIVSKDEKTRQVEGPGASRPRLTFRLRDAEKNCSSDTPNFQVGVPWSQGGLHGFATPAGLTNSFIGSGSLEPNVGQKTVGVLIVRAPISPARNHLGKAGVCPVLEKASRFPRTAGLNWF